MPLTLPHHLWLQDVATASVLTELPIIEVHGQVLRLVV